jgi:hypothetical protein
MYLTAGMPPIASSRELNAAFVSHQRKIIPFVLVDQTPQVHKFDLR